jgi:hypothetical protein
LPVKAKDGTIHIRLAEHDARVVREIARGEVVGAVDHDVVLADDLERVLRREPRLVQLDLHVRIEIRDARARGRELAVADFTRAVKDLALQIRDVDDVEVHDAERAHAGGGEIQGNGRPESAGADDEHARGLDAMLAVEADIGQQQMAAVAEELRSREIAAHFNRR